MEFYNKHTKSLFDDSEVYADDWDGGLLPPGGSTHPPESGPMQQQCNLPASVWPASLMTTRVYHLRNAQKNSPRKKKYKKLSSKKISNGLKTKKNRKFKIPIFWFNKNFEIARMR